MKDNHPIRSMTGYGASSFQVEGASYRIEIRSVNHRHINARFHMSSIFQGAENVATKALRERLGRGALDVRVAYETSQEPSGEVAVSVDLPLARALNTSLSELAEDLGVAAPSLEVLLRAGDLVRVEGRKMRGGDARGGDDDRGRANGEVRELEGGGVGDGAAAKRSGALGGDGVRDTGARTRGERGVRAINW